MMKVKATGIVLNETNYSETSKILNILTKEYGYISVMSKGCRTLKSKLRGISMKLVYADFIITYKENAISLLHEGNVINSLKNIMTDLEKMNYANYLLDLMKSILKDTNQKQLFYLLRDALLKINQDFSPSLITNIVEVKLLDYLGVKPIFYECINCSSKEIHTFSFSLGGVVCENCYENSYLFSKNTLKLLELFQKVEIDKIDKLNISSEKTREEINYFLEEYYTTYTGIYLKDKNKFKVNYFSSFIN